MTSSLFFRRLPRIALTALLLSGLCLLPPASATSFSPPQTTLLHAPVDPPTLIKHLRTELRSGDAVRQERALIDVIVLAGCPDTCTVSLLSADERSLRMYNDTGTGAVVDFDALIPDLLASYRSGPADGHRLLALSALINVGNETALERLIEEKEQQKSRVRKATDRSLAGFYLEKYPELTDRSLRRRSLSIEDVQQAAALQLKAIRADGQNQN
jgi:hypothetical protein